MKCKTIIDKTKEEEVVIYAHEKTPITERIEIAVNNALKEESSAILGYTGRDVVPVSASDVVCFSMEGGRLFAILQNEKLEIKERLYSVEEKLGTDFVKINQSCIANVKMIKKFDASLAGSLIVIFKNEHRDYVSRRQLKSVKKRMGF